MDVFGIAKIVQWNTKKGFGFAEVKGTKYFVHISAIKSSRAIRIGDTILVEKFGEGPKGLRIEKGRLEKDDSTKRNSGKHDKSKKRRANKKAFRKACFFVCIIAIAFCGIYSLMDKSTDKYPDIQNPSADSIPTVKVDFNKSYTSKIEVANYICQFGGLPQNYVAKHQARALYEQKTGQTFTEWNFNPLTTIGVMIGGDFYSNNEYLLPMGHWLEADVNYTESGRGTTRLVYNSSCTIFYTTDHFKSFNRIRFK